MKRIPAIESLCLSMWTVLAVFFAAPASMDAATVALAHTHMAAKPGSHQRTVKRFSAGVKAVYFDYSVLAPDATDAGEVRVFAGGVHGKVIASAPIILSLTTSLFATLQPEAGHWPKGSYCTVLYLDGAPDAANGRMPVGWAVGSAHIPSCGRARVSHSVIASITVHGALRVGLTTTLHVVVRDGKRKPVAGASVRLDGRTSGMARRRSVTTGSHGVATFKHLRPQRAGSVSITASHAGYTPRTVHLAVRA